MRGRDNEHPPRDHRKSQPKLLITPLLQDMVLSQECTQEVGTPSVTTKVLRACAVRFDANDGRFAIELLSLARKDGSPTISHVISHDARGPNGACAW